MPIAGGRERLLPNRLSSAAASPSRAGKILPAQPRPGGIGTGHAWEVRRWRRSSRPLTTVSLNDSRSITMDLLTFAIIALIVAIVAGALGFTNVAGAAATAAKIAFGIFLIIALILFVLVLLGIGAAAV